MRSNRFFARAPRFLAGVVLVLSGGYMLVYLYRWEWNRAILSGLFFVATEVALGTSMLLRRLRALEQRSAPPPDASADASPAPSPAALERLRATPVDRPDPFAWLTPRDGGLRVFVPVLLGAGAILSVLAYLVERVAEATAVPGIDRRLATRLQSLAPPDGGLLADRPTDSRPAAKAPRPPSRVAAATVAVAAVAVVGWIGGQWLLEATQTRPDPLDRPARTVIELSIERRGIADGAEQSAEALWVDCRSTLGSLPVVAEVDPLEGDRVALVLEPGIGRLGTRRLTGCLSDLRLNLVRATVLSVDSTE